MPSLDDVLIIVVYLLAVAYVIYQAINSLEDRTMVRVDQGALAGELEREELADKLQIQFGFKGSDRFSYDKQINSIPMVVINKSALPLQIDWDGCALVDCSGRSHRVVRMPPDKRISLWLYQAPSTIGPGAAMPSVITSEDHIQLNNEGFITDMKTLVSAKEVASSKDSVLSLFLWLRLHHLGTTPNGGDRTHLIRCTIQIVKLPWTDHLPF